MAKRLALCLALFVAPACAAAPIPACPNVGPGVTPNPAQATACPFEQAEQPPPNAYLRPAPAGQDAPDWLELALPSGRWLIHASDCNLTPWTEVVYHSSAPNVAGVNDCALDGWIMQSPEPCALSAPNVCDLTLDQSYQDWLQRQE